jgi:hypothetical protein
MHNDANPTRGRSGGEERAEEAHVRVRCSEGSLPDWLGRYPDGCSHRSRQCPSHHADNDTVPCVRVPGANVLPE